MTYVTSLDGTRIEYERSGGGPAVVLACGASVTRGANAGLAELLSKQFTVVNYDRRGRGGSGDTQPYAVQREVEDIAALIDAAGGSAHLYGASSGAALVLQAAASGLPVLKLALWEPPFMLDEDQPRRQREYVDALTGHLAAGRRDDAVALFMSLAGMPPEFIEQARSQPWFKGTEVIAHTLAYDAAVMGDGTLPAALATTVTAATLVLTGGETGPWAAAAGEALAQVLPQGTHRNLPGQTHNVAPEVLARPIAEFLSAP